MPMTLHRAESGTPRWTEILSAVMGDATKQHAANWVSGRIWRTLLCVAVLCGGGDAALLLMVARHILKSVYFLKAVSAFVEYHDCLIHCLRRAGEPMYRLYSPVLGCSKTFALPFFSPLGAMK